MPSSELKYINSGINRIATAEAPESVTNGLVADILRSIVDWFEMRADSSQTDSGAALEQLKMAVMKGDLELRWFDTGNSIGLFTKLGQQLAKVSNVARHTDVDNLQASFDTLTENRGTKVIDSIREFEEFLAGITNEATLTGILKQLDDKIHADFAADMPVVNIGIIPVESNKGGASVDGSSVLTQEIYAVSKQAIDDGKGIVGLFKVSIGGGNYVNLHISSYKWRDDIQGIQFECVASDATASNIRLYFIRVSIQKSFYDSSPLRRLDIPLTANAVFDLSKLVTSDGLSEFKETLQREMLGSDSPIGLGWLLGRDLVTSFHVDVDDTGAHINYEDMDSNGSGGEYSYCIPLVSPEKPGLMSPAMHMELAGKMDGHYEDTDRVIDDLEPLALERAKYKLFIDMWNTAWGEYGRYDPDNAPDPEHPFMGNDVWMTYEEAVLVMYESQPNELMLGPLNKTFANRRTRTLLPLRVRVLYVDVGLVATFFSSLNLEVIALDVKGYTETFRITHFGESAFANCRKLREVRGILSMKSSTANSAGAFGGCDALEEIRIKGLKADLSFADCPKISLATLEYIVDNAENTSAITITVHPVVYAKLTDEGNVEWHSVLTEAVARNINFATV